MVVRDALAMLVYSTAQNGMCQWVSGAGNFVTAEDKIKMCIRDSPKRMSLIIPPPTAVVTPNTMIPRRSRFCRIATIAPEEAKAMVPTASIRKKIEIEFPMIDQISCNYSK